MDDADFDGIVVELFGAGADGEEKSSSKSLDALDLVRLVVAAAGAGALSFPPNRSSAAFLDVAFLFTEESFLPEEEP